MTEGKEWDYLLKFLIIGDTAVGKTAMLLRYTDNTFDEGFISTIGVDFKIKKLEVDGKKLKIQIWDTAGQEKFHTITQSYYRGSHAIIVVYDCTDRKTFESSKQWLAEIDNETSGNVCRVLVGNKCDKPKDVTIEEATEFATSQNIKIIETSAKENIGISETFEYVVSEVVKKLKDEQIKKDEKIDISQKKNKKSCC
ncbi:GTP-binding protein ypt2 [Entamoeba marina]